MLLLLLLQTLIGFGCGVTMLYRQATLNTAFLLGRVLVTQLTNVHPAPCTRSVASLNPQPCLYTCLFNEFLSFTVQHNTLSKCTAEMNKEQEKM